MKFETLKTGKFAAHKKTIIGITAVVLVLVASFTIYHTFAKYQSTQSVKLAQGTVNYKVADLDMVAMYAKDASGNLTVIDTAPTSGYLLNTTSSYCAVNGTKDTSIGIAYSGGKLTISNLTKRGTKCYIYFDIITDTTKPTISNVATTVTKNQINVTVTASDDKGLAKYYYKIDSGNYVEKTTNTHSFTGLAAGSTHTISVYVTDTSGNQSTITTKTVTTEPDGQTASTILAGLTKRNRGSITGPLTTDTTGTIFSAADDDGTSYYYAGVVNNNWVKFAGFYWRIIRFNGNGSIRLIYQGTSATSTGTDAQIGISAFNNLYDDNMYVGYKYTSRQVHGIGTDSTIKGVLDTWYNNNLKSYASKIDINAGFCNDREPSTNQSSSNGYGGTITTITYYGAYIRFMSGGSWASTQVPTLKCKNISTDYFTVSGANKGNKALTNPIGLISVDEVSYSGGFGISDNTSYYLYTSQPYWSMSPWVFNSAYASMFLVDQVGSILVNPANNTYGVRPVINLRADTLFATGGNGTSSNPYVVQ